MIGLYMIVGRFFVDAAVRSRTTYALTNQRVMILSGLFGRNITSLPLKTLTGISLQERGDGSGTLYFGQPNPHARWTHGIHWPELEKAQTPCFELIKDAKRVHDQVLDAQRAAA